MKRVTRVFAVFLSLLILIAMMPNEVLAAKSLNRRTIHLKFIFVDEDSGYVAANDGTVTDSHMAELKVTDDNARKLIFSHSTGVESLDRTSVSRTEAYYTLAVASDYVSPTIVTVTFTDTEDKSDSITITFERTSNPAPVNTKAPTLSAKSVIEGETITYSQGTWTDDDPLTITHEWMIADTENGTYTFMQSGGTDYITQDGDAGKFIKVIETADDGISTSTAETVVCTVTENQPPDPSDNVIDYISLGDSMATGTVAPDLADTIPYPIDFSASLDALDDRTVDSSYFAVDGYQSGDLLTQLQTNISLQDEIQDGGDVITISIGGNNLMQASITGTVLGYTIYDFNTYDESIADAGRLEFAEDFPDIMSYIRNDLGYEGEIIVHNMYNPTYFADANHEKVNNDLYASDGLGINDVIENTDYIDLYDYQVADVYQEFADNITSMNMIPSSQLTNEVTYFYITDVKRVFFFMTFPLRNPHPTQVGQGILLNAIEEQCSLIQ